MGHRRIICVGTKEQYYDAKDAIHRLENPAYHQALDSGKMDEEEAYRWYTPDDIFMADWVAIAHSGSTQFDNISKENFLLNLDKKYPFYVFDDENLFFDARPIDVLGGAEKIELECLTRDEVMERITSLPSNTLLQLLDSHW